MKHKYRIVKRTYKDGTERFYPQGRRQLVLFLYGEWCYIAKSAYGNYRLYHYNAEGHSDHVNAHEVIEKHKEQLKKDKLGEYKEEVFVKYSPALELQEK